MAPQSLIKILKGHLNFFRIHVLFLTFTPLIFSGIFYAANRGTHVSYIDALYCCYSAISGCGLATVDLSSLTGFQQALLSVQQAIGSPIVVSWMMVFVRRQYFAAYAHKIADANLHCVGQLTESGELICDSGTQDQKPYPVRKNSKSQLDTASGQDEQDNIEYRSLTALLYLVAFYYFSIQLLAFIVIAPYMSAQRWTDTFEPPLLHKKIKPTWFSAFQVISAFTNSGMSLADTNMNPYREAYPMVILMSILVLAGNTAFPIFLRFMIWTITKFMPKGSQINKTLHYLLDHPRRCFIYLFPSYQTWFLLTVLVILNGTGWFCFMVLDPGNNVVESIPIGVRLIDGLFQATSVRTAGFAIVPMSSIAPAVQTLFVILMYIGVYPIALSVRATNVYEEKPLGVWSDGEDEPGAEGNKIIVWGKYLSWHARRQLAYDMWCLAAALFALCIIEKDKIQNEQNLSWFTQFSIIFELVSAYGEVGLSLGLPYANYSFSGAFTTGSKLILCAVMLRGRHRGLPDAIDCHVTLATGNQGVKADEESDMKERQGDNESSLGGTALAV